MSYWYAGAVVVGSVISSQTQSDSAEDAAQQQSDAARAANQTQQDQYDQVRRDNIPLLDTRNNALAQINMLQSDPSSVTRDPNYQWGLNQGQQSIDRSAAGRGSLYSGATLRALNRYGQDYASSQIDRTYNRLASQAGLGQVGGSLNAQAGMNYANQVGQNALGMGNVNAAATLAQGNIWGNALNQGISTYGRYQGAGAGSGQQYDPNYDSGGYYSENGSDAGIRW